MKTNSLSAVAGTADTPTTTTTTTISTENTALIKSIGSDLYFYADVSKENILQLNELLLKLKKDLRIAAIERGLQTTSINLHINSYGGEVFSGFLGADMILNSDIPIDTIVEGATASAATLMSVCGNNRFITRNAHMLIHQLSGGFWGKWEAILDEVKNKEKMMTRIKALYLMYTKVPEDKLDEILRHDLWMDSDDCLKYGLVDKIL
jgi:ATP-dependent protease ClpP protease subunit